MSTIDDEVRDRVSLVLRRQLTLEDFEAWLVANTWDDRTPLVAQVDHLVAERSVLPEDTFVDQLWRAVATIHVVDAPAPATGTSSTTILPGFASWATTTVRCRFEFAGRSHEEAHA